MNDLFGCDNDAVALINLNSFLKILLFQIANEFLNFMHRGLSDSGIQGVSYPASKRVFAYFLRVMISEYSTNQTIMKFITLIFLKPQMHRELQQHISESLRLETVYFGDFKFTDEGIFSETDQDTLDLLRALHEGKVEPSVIYSRIEEPEDKPINPGSGYYYLMI